MVSWLRNGTQSTFDDMAAGAGNSPGGDDKDDSLGAKGAQGEPESKKHKVVAPYRQGCVGTLLYSTQKAKLLTELPPGTTLILRSWEKRQGTNGKTGENFINYNLTDIHGGFGLQPTALFSGEQQWTMEMWMSQTTTHTTWNSTRTRMASIQ